MQNKVDRIKTLGVRVDKVKKVEKVDFKSVKTIFHEFWSGSGCPRVVAHRVGYKTGWCGIPPKFGKNTV